METYSGTSLDQDYLQAHFPQGKVEVHSSLSSTQDHLKDKLHTISQPILCLAEEQTAGRGRGLNRKWSSPFGANIYLSYACFSPKKMHELEGLSLVIGLAIVEVLQGLNVEAKIKWPNDVFCHGKKMAGVLIEAFNNQEHGSKLIIGIGINVNMSSASQDEITQAWTSVIMETGKVHNRNTLVSAIIRKTQQNLCSFEQTGLASFLPIWQQYDHLYDQEVTLQAGTQLLSGQVKGVNEQGYLLLRLQDGEVRGFSSGEASIKKKV